MALTDKDRDRIAEAVAFALENGAVAEEVLAEAQYAIETFEAEQPDA